MVPDAVGLLLLHHPQHKRKGVNRKVRTLSRRLASVWFTHRGHPRTISRTCRRWTGPRGRLRTATSSSVLQRVFSPRRCGQVDLGIELGVKPSAETRRQPLGAGVRAHPCVTGHEDHAVVWFFVLDLPCHVVTTLVPPVRRACPCSSGNSTSGVAHGSAWWRRPLGRSPSLVAHVPRRGDRSSHACRCPSGPGPPTTLVSHRRA
jgi:hypothetical protein